MKLPNNVQAAVDAYQAESAKYETLASVHQTALDKLDGELASAKADLTAAAANTFTKPTPANIEAEAKLARKVQEIEANISAAKERLYTAVTGQSGRLMQLADAAIIEGKYEAQRHYNGNLDAKLAAIADAKYAYLQALVDMHTLREDARDIYQIAASETNTARADKLDKPHFLEITPFYRGGNRQEHGVSDQEIIRAYKYGKIERTSVAPGREVI